MNSNPYVPPRQETDIEARSALGGHAYGGGLRREGNFIVVPVTGSEFPPRCVTCNEPEVKRVKPRVYWHHPGYYALLLLGWTYVIAVIFVNKSADIEVGLCAEHAARRRNGLLLGWLGSFGFIAAAAALGDAHPALAGVCVLGLFGCFFASIRIVRMVKAKRIDKQYAWLKLGAAFRDSIET